MITYRTSRQEVEQASVSTLHTDPVQGLDSS